MLLIQFKQFDNIVDPSVAGHPNTIIFLTADAFGVLPPISKLTKEQAMYHFLSGFTSKLAGTETWCYVTTSNILNLLRFSIPSITCNSVCRNVGKKIDEHDAQVFLVNTGWTGGEYGVGNRMKLSYTRTMVRAAIEGK